MNKLLLKSLTTIGRTFAFEETLVDADGDTKFTSTREVTLAEGENLDVELRKLCDNDIEIFIDGLSIGKGVLNKGAGMAVGEIEEKAAEGVQNVGPNGTDNVGDPDVKDEVKE